MAKMALFDKGVLDKQTEISMLVKQTKAQWSDEDLKRVKDLQKYTLDKEDSWVLDEALLNFVGDVLKSLCIEKAFEAFTGVMWKCLWCLCRGERGGVNLTNQTSKIFLKILTSY